eukprot:674777-Rhodomonas_salina.3
MSGLSPAHEAMPQDEALHGLRHAEDGSERQHAHSEDQSNQQRSTARHVETTGDEEDLCAICLESLPPLADEFSKKQCTTRCGHRFHEA